MSRKINEQMYEKACIKDPTLLEQKCDWYAGGTRSIAIELENGNSVIYDAYTERFRPMDHDDNNLNCEFTKEEKETFSANLKGRLTELNITRQDLALVTGIPNGTIAKYVGGHGLPTYGSLLKVTEVLDCSPADLTTKHEEKKEEEVCE